jgi:G3E family GTPase
MSRPGRQTRLSLVAGFLGAGKSTWLRHQLARGALAGARVIVNEAAATPVDQRLLAGAGPVRVLAGGCACCEARSDLLALLRRMRPDPALEEADADRIVLELSGLADPRPIVAAVRDDPELSAWLRVSETIVLLGAPHGVDRLRREPLMRRQIACADCVIITKLDAGNDGEASELRAAVELLNPSAPVFGAVRGVETPLPIAAPVPPEGVLDVVSDKGADPLLADCLSIGPVDWTVFALWLSALLTARSDDVVRVKGVVATPAGRLLLQAVGAQVDAPEILSGPAAPEDGTVVVIGRGFAPGDIQRSFEAFAAACQDEGSERRHFTAFRPSG